jgi:hypothetical protein
VSFQGTIVKILSKDKHVRFAGFQCNQLLQHVPIGRVNRDIPLQLIQLDSFLNILRRSREDAYKAKELSETSRYVGRMVVPDKVKICRAS